MTSNAKNLQYFQMCGSSCEEMECFHVDLDVFLDEETNENWRNYKLKMHHA